MSPTTLLAVWLLVSTPARAQTGAVRRVGPLLDAQGNGARILGQDCAYSVDMGEGSLWLFGDTFIGRWRRALQPKATGAVSNNSAWSTRQDAAKGIRLKHRTDGEGAAAPLFSYDSSENPESTRLWPGHGVMIGKKVYVYYQLLRRPTPAADDFVHAGQGLAVGTAPLEPFTRLRSGGRLAFWGGGQPRFGVAVLKAQDGWIYVYGREEDKPNRFKLARVRPDSIASLDRYEYLSGDPAKPQWVRDLSQAAPMFSDGPPEASVSYNFFLGRYLMLYSRFLEGDVVVRTADAPWGPWSEPTVVFRCPLKKRGSFCYAGKEHPEYAKAGGRVVYFTLVDSGRALGGVADLFELTFSDKP